LAPAPDSDQALPPLQARQVLPARHGLLQILLSDDG
jgi:hypothetical protein